MIESTNIIISFINFFSLLLGGIAIGLTYKLTKQSNIPYLNHYFFFIICAVVTGFCDWIIFNWILLLVPGISTETTDFIYHIFWDLIGFPSLLFASFFLIRAINGMLKIKVRRLSNSIFISLLLIISILAYIGFYFRLQNKPNIFLKPIWIIYTYVIPFTLLSYLAFAFLRSIKIKAKDFPLNKFVLILFFSFLFWIFLSLVPINFGVWRHIIIFTFYLSVFLPAVYLFSRQKDFKTIPKIQSRDKLQDIFRDYKFTTREKELAFLLMEGKSNKEISEELFVSLQTVKNYISRIYKKIGLKNRVQFVNFIRKHLD